jgi:hypothetical protein
MARKESDNGDDYLKYCPICKFVWEIPEDDYYKYPIHYADFPSRGKEREVCRTCKEND